MITPIQRIMDTSGLVNTVRGQTTVKEGALFPRLMEEQFRKSAERADSSETARDTKRMAQKAGLAPSPEAAAPTAGAANSAVGSILSEAEKEKERQRLREACQEFEALYIHQMLKGMRSTVPKSDLIEEAPGRKIWESMLDEEYAKSMAKREEVGFAKMLYKELSRPLE
ncbi:conserved hypothetical protein [Heliomicrobium modesticaldum Ice1]|uniref:Flagellar protein FlgJ N-terminal domain-containing protein n=1 Tax=Heliobacterium modesticaldum (strain ATCC 51547 / Ice1) TaxID=498761 RepID=B0TFL3_HELMI|nr:rod-binding protein [Heliomicrobium modesticaldum]ABZ83112.1 conserved hypothetical protein [Heliomicrobium modesticaldum Ice1]